MSEAEAFRVLQPQEYLNKFLQSGIRPDGRLFNAVRPVRVECGRMRVVATRLIA